MPALITEGSEEAGAEPTLGRMAPDFELPTADGGKWRLSAHAGHVRVLLFYPQNETLVCSRQLCSVRDNWKQYKDTRAQLIAISPHDADNNRIFASNRSLPMPMLSDEDRQVTREFAKHWLLPVSMTRAIVVIDAEGRIRTRAVMFRALRPTDDSLLAAIYAARGDALSDQFSKLRSARIGVRPL